jgi:hypothetical protein
MKTILISRLWYILIPVLLISCEKDETNEVADGRFFSFQADGQTILSASINSFKQQVKFEVKSDVDVTKLVPEFQVSEGCSVYIDGSEQVSGSSVVDFSQPVTYELVSANGLKSAWVASAIPLCKKIVIDASHDGGVWWYPQSPLTGFNPEKDHQGKRFADTLRARGFEVDELGRDRELKEEDFFGYYIIIRINGFEPYSNNELNIYTKLVERGMNLVFFTDHKRYDRTDELGDLLGLQFEGVARGTISKFTPHAITENLTDLDFLGSVLTNAGQNPDIEILGWLGEDDYADLNFNDVQDPDEPVSPPVMGILHYPNSKVFFLGDSNTFQWMPQPFINNLMVWMRE